MKVVQIINEVGINDKCGGYLRLIPLVLLLVPPTLLLLVPPGGTDVFPCSHLLYGKGSMAVDGGTPLTCYLAHCADVI